MSTTLSMVEQFQKERDEILKTFNEIDSETIDDKKFFNFKHKCMSTSARITLTYGDEVIINRPSIIDIKTEFFHDKK